MKHAALALWISCTVPVVAVLAFFAWLFTETAALSRWFAERTLGALERVNRHLQRLIERNL